MISQSATFKGDYFDVSHINGNLPGKDSRDIIPILTTILGILDKHHSQIY